MRRAVSAELVRAWVVFLVGAHGSDMPTFRRIKNEISSRILKLHPTETFDIIVYQGGAVPKLSPTLVPATDSNRRRASDFLASIAAEGLTEPIPALEAALNLHPKVIYFVEGYGFSFPNEMAFARRLTFTRKAAAFKLTPFL